MTEYFSYLTIAIPTYNRHAQLTNTLNRLLPQMNEYCKLIIIDNCSDEPAKEATQAIFQKHDNINYTIYRNNVNIGGDSNIMRCFEYCETRWLWTLGDDDEILGNAISTIFEDIKRYPNILNINYNSPSPERPVRKTSITSTNRYEFLRNMDSLGAMMYMSCNIYDNSKLKEVFYLSNYNTYSCASQWLVLLYILSKENHDTILSDKVICKNPVVPSPDSTISVVIAKGLSTLLDIPLSVNEKKILITKLKTEVCFSIEGVLKGLLIMYSKDNKIDIRFLFNRYNHLLYRHFGLRSILKFKIYQFLLFLSPSLLFKAIKHYFLKFRGNPIVML